MPFRFRTSVSAGPFRLNLSKSGLGISAGVRGLRIGTGPRGNYVHIGRSRLHYKRSHDLRPSQEGSRSESHSNEPPMLGRMDDIKMKEVESGSVLKMQDASAADLLTEFNEKQKHALLWPWFAALFGGAAAIAFMQEVPTVLIVACVLPAFAITLAVAALDRRQKMVVLLYELEPEVEEAYRRVHDTFDELGKAKGKWHVEAEGNVRDSKYYAGAGVVVKRSAIRFSSEPPKNIKTNITVPCIPVGRQVLCFFPDRLLVFERNAVGAVSYENLEIDVTPTQFIEDSTPPRDAERVGRTWRYVNKNGGPDRRFKNNRELPVMLYEDVRFRSDSGLNEYIQFSVVGPAESFAQAVMRMVPT